MDFSFLLIYTEITILRGDSMLDFLLSKIRTDKHMSKTKLSELTNINIGHLSHIEKGERIPSHKALKEISKALDIPYKNLMHAYDHDLSDEQIWCCEPRTI